MPFQEGDDADPYIIMSIVSDLALPFNTKKRAPFKVVFETLKLSELIKIKQREEAIGFTKDIN